MNALTMVQYKQAADFLRGRFPNGADTAVVLGSGLDGFTARVREGYAVPYCDIPHAPGTTNQAHKGELLCGRVEGRPVYVLSGRVHAYEGYSLADTAFFVRVLHLLGVKNLILTNAAGGIAPELSVGDFMCISDHLYFFDDSPVRGPHLPAFGPRFFDMSNAYDKSLRQTALAVIKELHLPPREGVYAYMPGPQYETPAEIRALRALGADAVGMSTVAEAIAAAQCGMRTLGISCITNPAAGISLTPLSDDDVTETAARRSEDFIRLLCGILTKI